jgi:PKD repeat protein
MQIVTVGNRTFQVEGPYDVAMAQIQGMVNPGQGGCASCGGGAGMLKLGTATCGGPYTQNTTHNLTASVTNGTAPFTFTWTITPPTGSPVTLTGASQTYTFAQAGSYTINMTVRDSCPTGGLTDSATCSVQVNASCVNPSCAINIV